MAIALRYQLIHIGVRDEGEVMFSREALATEFFVLFEKFGIGLVCDANELTDAFASGFDGGVDENISGSDI